MSNNRPPDETPIWLRFQVERICQEYMGAIDLLKLIIADKLKRGNKRAENAKRIPATQPTSRAIPSDAGE